jgi:hypothetical protein
MHDVTHSIAPIPTLAALRDRVLARSQTRAPKWGFRLAPDLVLQLQPKPTAVLFRGVVVWAPHATVPASIFRERPEWTALPQVRVNFWIRGAPGSEHWHLSRLGSRFSHGLQGDRRTPWTRLVAAFTDGAFDRLDPNLMLAPACLACGRPLTDPVSMARWIGPECAASSSATIPHVFKAGGVQ